MKKIICLIDLKDLTEEQKLKVFCLYKVRKEKIKDFTIEIDKIYDEGDFT